MPPLRSPIASHRTRRLLAASRKREHELVWLFDLDNTLHDCSRHIFKAIDGAMSAAMCELLDMDWPEADALRHEYWARYGATVIGLERHHGIEADAFLEASHRFDVASLVHAESGIARKLASLPGRKILLTNAPHRYARDVLRTLGILQEFETLWTMDHMRLQGRLKPKPSPAMMRQLLARLRVPADHVILVDDTLKNLRTAKSLGMRTVLSHHPGTPHNPHHHGRSHYVDMKVNRIGHLLTDRHRRVGDY